MTPAQEQAALDKRKVLAAMMAGTKTKESEALRVKTVLYEDKDARNSVDPRLLEQKVNNYISATEMSSVDLNNQLTEQKRVDAKGFAPVDAADIQFLLGGKRGDKPVKQAPSIQELASKMVAINNHSSVSGNKQQPQKSLQTVPVGGLEDDNDLKFEAILQQKQQLLKDKLNSKSNISVQPTQQSRQLLQEDYLLENQLRLTEEISVLVENLVYDILGDLIEEANQNLINKESIKIKIGESLFVGKLQKSLSKPVKR